MATPGTIITATELNSIWTPVQSAASGVTSMRDTEFVVFNFDGLDQAGGDSVGNIRYWTPTVDAAILSVCITATDPAQDFTVTINGQMNQELKIPITATPTVRQNITLPAGRFGVLTGDNITVTVTGYGGAAPTTLRVHIAVSSAWTRL